MENPPQSFNKLLEQYAFSVAANFIDKLDKQEQDNLIQFIISLDTTSDPVNQGQAAKSKLDETAEQNSLEVGKAPDPETIETKEQKSLPGLKRPVESQQHTTYVSHLIAIHQVQIDSTILQLIKLRQLIERAERLAAKSVSQLDLVSRYQLIYDRCVLYLAMIQARQEKQINRLHPYGMQLP